MIDRSLLLSHLVLGLFFQRFWITASISVLVIGLFIIYISSWFSLGRLNFTKNLSISSRLSVLLPYSSSYVSYNPLYMCIVCCNFSFFIYFCLELYKFFPSTNYGFLCSSFSHCFRCKVRLSVRCFFLFVLL